MKNRILNFTAFGILTILWLGFLVALILNRDLLVFAWQAFRTWPLVLQVIVGLLTLPVVLGLWIWQTTWSVWIRLVLVLGLAWVTIYTFFPRKTPDQVATTPGKS